MKKRLARLALRWMSDRFRRSPSAFDQLMGRAVALQLGEIDEDRFRQELAAFFAGVDPAQFMEEIDFPAKERRLNQPGGYKADVMSLRERPSRALLPRRLDPWARRFGLLRHLGVRLDVLILREGEQIPPHGHYRVVSGFLVLSGEVAARNYDRVQERDGGVLVRKVFDSVLGPGGFTTNSEHYHNIHWLIGLAPVSYLFRVTVLGTKVATFGGPGRTDTRVYVDPTAAPDDSGLILAPYIDDRAAKQLAWGPLVRA